MSSSVSEQELREMIEDAQSSVQGDDDLIPEDPGPALIGKTPVIGQVRRNNDLPVLRDELAEELKD